MALKKAKNFSNSCKCLVMFTSNKEININGIRIKIEKLCIAVGLNLSGME
jgi:hypothetical protein